MSSPAEPLRVSDVLDAQPSLSRQQWCVVALCFACLVLDGFDVQVIGYLAPAIIADWSIAKEALTPVFTAGLLGMLVGSFILSWLADRIGRRPVLIGSAIAFGLCMIATAFVENLSQLVLLRFVTGLGLGGIMPNAMALSGEFVPRRMRVSVMMAVACGFTIGAALGGFIVAGLVDLYGWRSLFLLGGLAPIFLALIMVRALPESLQFQLIKGISPDLAARKLRTLIPSWPHDEQRALMPEAPAGPSGTLRELFAPGRGAGTCLIWAANFMNLLILYFVSSWLPTLLTRAGYDHEVAILTGTSVQLGGIVGTLSMGRIIDMVGFRRVMPLAFGVASFVLLIAGRDLPPAALYPVFACIGFCIMGGQPALNSYSASFYPVSVRATGIGWGLGVGRFGSVLGPVVGGQLIALGWDNARILALLGVPALALAIITFAMPSRKES